MKKILKIIILFSILFFYENVFAYSSPGNPVGFVTDFSNIISDQAESSLDIQLKNFSASTTIEIAVVTVNSLEGDSVENYANELFREWGIGKKEYNNGILFLIAPNERKARIEVGYGLEGIMPDIQAGYIMDNIIIPEFKNGNYEKGIIEGTNSIQSVVMGEEFDSVNSNFNQGELNKQTYFINLGGFGLILIALALQGIISLLASTKSWWLGGVFGLMAGIGISYSFGFSSISWVLILVFSMSGLLFDYYISKSYKKYKRYGGKMSPIAWGFSRGVGGSGGRGGGGGGFGGGSSGGGGASGSW